MMIPDKESVVNLSEVNRLSPSRRFCEVFFVCLPLLLWTQQGPAQSGASGQSTLASPIASQAPPSTSHPVPAPQSPDAQQLDLSVSANAVSLDLVVRDKGGKPVLDLRPDEIAVTDNNAPVALENLHLVNKQQGGDHLISLVFDRPVPASGKEHSIDLYAKPAQDAAAMILKMVPQGRFSFAVLSVEGRLHLQQGFTSDRTVIAQAVNEATKPLKMASGSTVSDKEKDLILLAKTGSTPEGAAASPSDRQLAQALYTALDHSGRIETDEHMRPSLASMLAMVQAQQQLKQRKAIIYFTYENQEQLDSHATVTMKSIVGAANLAGVSIYIVDLNALDNTGRKTAAIDEQVEYDQGMQLESSRISNSVAYTNTSSQMQTFASGVAADFTNFRILSDREEDKSEFQKLAEGTGGGYISTADGLRKPVKQMVEDLTTYYQASYVPVIKDYDGSFRSIAVKPLRAGLKVRSQTGYLALPAGFVAGTTPQPFELPLLKILTQTQLPADVPFRASILRIGNLTEGNVSTLAIEVPLSGVEVRQDSSTNLFSAHVCIVGEIRDKSGEVIEHFSEDVPRRGALKDVQTGSLSAITVQRHFVAPAGDYVLEAAVLDVNSGKSGAERQAFQIQDPSSTPYLSDLMLVRKMELVKPTDDPNEPLLYGDKRITPNLSGELPPGNHDISLFVIAHSDPGKTEPAELTFQIFKDGKPLGGTLAANHQATSSEYTSYVSSFSIKSAESGTYQVKAFLRQGGKAAEADTSFTLTGIPSANVVATALIDPINVAIPPPAGELPITLPKDPIQRPEPEELKSILADAAQYATQYSAALPNFMCQQVTSRLEDRNGAGAWRQKDKIVEMLTYFNHKENRKLLQIDTIGARTHEATSDTQTGVSSFGEFGQALTSVFQASSKADFEWKETDVLGDQTVQVFDYRVAKKDSSFDLIWRGLDATVGFHGQVFIDTATRGVHRVTMTADDVPEKFPLRASSVSVDYDYVQLNDHDYLMPTAAEVNTWEGNHGYLNQIEFRNFHRFGSTVKILDSPPDPR
jgi:VWFA-related protein